MKTAEQRRKAAWTAMVNRCTNPNTDRYANYGGRGIAVCGRWLGDDGYANFAADLGEHPGKGWSLERKDVNRGYEPDNCCWIPTRDQARNQTRSVWLTIEGRRQLMTDWAREYNVPDVTIHQRIKRGWSPEMAVKVPPDSRRGRWAKKQVQQECV